MLWKPLNYILKCPIYILRKSAWEKSFDNSFYKKYNYIMEIDIYKETKMKNFVMTLLNIFVLLFFIATFSFADTAPGPPTAKKILFITTGAIAFPGVMKELQNAGSCTVPGPANAVTAVTAWPADLTTACGGGPCDQVWDFRYSDPTNQTLTPAMRTALETYMTTGGTVFVLGENASNPKPGLDNFVNDVVASGTYNGSGVGTGNGGEFLKLDSAACTIAEDFANDYQALGACALGAVQADWPGQILVTQLAGGHGVYTNAAGTKATGIAYRGIDLKPIYSGSKLFLWYDYQAMLNMTNCSCANYANMEMIKNIMDFLVPPTATPTFTQTATPTVTPTATPTTPIIITKTISKTIVALNDAITYCFDFTNGTSATQNFVLWDTIPAVTDYVGCDNSCSTVTIGGNVIVYWNVSIAASASKHLCFWVNAARFPLFKLRGIKYAVYDGENNIIPPEEAKFSAHEEICFDKPDYRNTP